MSAIGSVGSSTQIISPQAQGGASKPATPPPAAATSQAAKVSSGDADHDGDHDGGLNVTA